MADRGLPANPPVTVYVRYTKGASDELANIEYFRDAAGESRYEKEDKLPTVPHQTKTKFTFEKTNATDGFDFAALTFWPKNDEGTIANVSQNFREVSTGTANFRGITHVDSINLQPASSAIFWVFNRNETVENGAVAVHATILTHDTGIYLTSLDPEVPVPKE